ncbi:MAG TPA: hypothetical protein VNX29_05410 [Kaistia sp.]|nr:hypothetical protein [Kaistia sp.]
MGAFARPVAFLPKGGSPFLGRGDFRRPTEDVQLSEGEMTTAAPTLGVRASELDAMPRQNDGVYVDIVADPAEPLGFRVTPRSQRFKIVDVRPDGEGDLKLVLAQVSSP